MDPEFAEQLRLYELERARKEGRDHLADLADISDGDLSPSDSEAPGSGQAEAGMTELGRRVLDRLKKLRQQFGGGDGAPSLTDDAKMKTEDEPEAQGMWRKRQHRKLISCGSILNVGTSERSITTYLFISIFIFL